MKQRCLICKKKIGKTGIVHIIKTNDEEKEVCFGCFYKIGCIAIEKGLLKENIHDK